MAAHPFQCEWHKGCSMSFNRKSDLKRHYRIHTNERPYTCDTEPCNKTFRQRGALTVHRRIHTGDKPHECPFLGCGKRFSDSSSLARHRRIHTNDKPYICRNQRCEKSFSRRLRMEEHFRRKHSPEPVRDDQDIEYSDIDVSDSKSQDGNTNKIKKEPLGHYEEPSDSKATPSGRPEGNGYHVNLWALPRQTAQWSIPLQKQMSAVPRSEAPCQEMKFARSSSANTYPDGQRYPSDYPLSRVDMTPGNFMTSSTMLHINGSMLQQYQLRNHDSSVGLWSPTSLTHSSPGSASTQGHQMQFSSHEALVSNTTQQHLDQPPQQQFRDMASTLVHQNPYDGGIQQHVPQQEPYIAMFRGVSQHHSYDEPTPQSAIQQYPDDLPVTPAPTQQLPQYTTSMVETPYQQSQHILLDNYSVSNQVPPNGGLYQHNSITSNWFEDATIGRLHARSPVATLP